MTKTSLFLALVLAACRRESRSVEPLSAALQGDRSPAMSSALSSEGADLDALDTRTPLPLLPMMADHQKQNMRDHLLAVEEIVAGAAVGDFAAVERASARIGYSDQMGRMCTHMGAGARGFTERALAFHHAADDIAAAARDHDQTRVLGALGVTLARCTGCHAEYKQRVVDEAAWKRLTSGPEQ